MVDSGMYVLTNVSVGAQVGILEEGNQSFGSTVFPNPSSATQIVMINSKYNQPITQISIMNAMGQIVTKKVFDDGEDRGGYVIPTQELRPGVYHIQINYKDQKAEVVRFIKN